MNDDRVNKIKSMSQEPAMPTVTPVASPYQVGPGSRPMMQQVPTAPVTKPNNTKLILIIATIAASLVAVAFAGLFVWMMTERNEAQSDIDTKISLAVTAAKEEQREADLLEFDEIEKTPYKVFYGPTDYGSLSFEYPKSWSVYVAESAVNGGNFSAYLNPDQVEAVSNNTVNALRVKILNTSFEAVTQNYQQLIAGGKTDLTMISANIGKNDSIVANLYTGTLPDSTLIGYMVVFKIRDKTAILQTDSVLFESDFEKLLQTVTFNE